MKTTNTKRTKSKRAKRAAAAPLTSHEAAHAEVQNLLPNASAQLKAVNRDIARLLDASRVRAITSRVAPANDVDVAPESLTDKRHLIEFARDLRIASWRGCEEHRGTDVERLYREECTIEEPETRVVARFMREIGHELSEVPLPIGARAWHLTISGSLTEFDRNLLVRSVFTSVPNADLVHVRPPGDLEGTLHVFVLADAGWRPIGPPAWLREPAANEARLIAPPARVFPEGVLPHLVRGGR